MGRRLAGWRSLSWRQRAVLLVCMAGVTGVHACLLLYGYARTRRLIESLTPAADTRQASETELAHAKSVAHLAAIAGRHGAVNASCLRQSLLLYGWLRHCGLRPTLLLGIKAEEGRAPFQAHAWVELDGTPLLPGDSGHRPFRGPGEEASG